MNMLETAYEYEKMGLFPIPAEVQKNSCKITARWKDSPEKVDGWENLFSTQNGIAIKLGEDSNNIQVIDVDQKHDSTCTLSNRFMQAIKYMLPDSYDDFYIEETRSGGLHVFFRTEDKAPNKFVPAKTIDNGKKHALIECLGEGNIVFTHPTPMYIVKQGSIEEIPTLSKADYDELISVCKSFNELPEDNIKEFKYQYTPDDDNDKRTGSIFNRKIEPDRVAAFLVEEGWKVVKRDGDKYWLTRPGKDIGISATFNHDDRKLLIVFSSSTDFEPMKGYKPFSILSKLRFEDNFKRTTAYLIEKGYVDQDEWEDVEPLKKHIAKPFDLDKLIPDGCEMFKRYIHEIAESYQVQPEMALLPAVVTTSLCIASAAKIRISADWIEEAVLWAFIGAQASERKSPVLNMVAKPIKKHFDDFKVRCRKAIAQLKRTKGGVLSRIKKLEADYDKAASLDKDTTKIEGLIQKAESELEKMPKILSLPSLVQSDITAEALIRALFTNGETLGIISAEADAIDVALGQYGNSPNLSIYLKSFTGEPYKVNRVHNGECELDQPRLAMCVLMQKEPLEKLVNNESARDRGFLARAFFAIPESRVGSRKTETTPVSEDAKYWWETKVRNLLSMPHRLRLYEDNGKVIFHDKDPKIVELSDEAHELLKIYREDNEKKLAQDGELDDGCGWGGKLIGNICRLTLSLHFISGSGFKDKVSLNVMQSALNWMEPLTDHYYCALGYVGDQPIDKRVHSTIKRISELGIVDGTSVRDVFLSIKTRKYNKISDWENVFNRLVELGFIRIVDGEKPKAGPTPKIVQFHPKFRELAK